MCWPYSDPEPLSDDFGEYLHQKCAKKWVIKPWLMDNKLVVGVGNIYASESLFAAGISLHWLASSLSLAECELLARVIKAVLLRSIEQGGTTLKNVSGKPMVNWAIFRAGIAGLRAKRRAVSGVRYADCGD